VTARNDRQAILYLAAAIAAGLLLRLLVFRGSGFPSDVGTFMAWAERLAQVGPSGFYAPGYFSDYPPAFLYVLWLVGALFDGEALRLVVKLLSVPADIAISVLLFRLVSRSAGATLGAAAGGLWILQPGPIFAGPYWGQVDSWGTLPFLAALVAAGERRWVLAAALAATAGMVKPQFGLAALVVGGAALAHSCRTGRWSVALAVTGSGIGTAVLLALPFGMTPGAFVELVRSASETYPYTSLYAFNGWSIVADFWKPDVAYVFTGGALLVAGILASLLPLWWRRDTAMLLAVGAFAAMAFYFLPTRAHERYIFPALALLVPFAVTRTRVFVPYVVLAITFFVTLYFAFSRYPQNGLVPTQIVESMLFSRSGQILLALLMIGSAAVLVWRLVRGEARLAATADLPVPRPPALSARAWQLPEGLRPGYPPGRRIVMVALVVALAVVATRGFRLDHPRDMYFDEVYHARTAFELLAQREPYEWTHPHLAKEIMAAGIAAFGGDRVVEGEDGSPGAAAFAVSNDGLRAYALPDGASIRMFGRGGEWLPRRDVADDGTPAEFDLYPPRGPVEALAFDGGELVALAGPHLVRFDAATGDILETRERAPGEPTSFAVARGRAVVGTAAGVEIHTLSGEGDVRRVPIPVSALTLKPDGEEAYVADPQGVIHAIDLNTGQETGRMEGGGPVSALAYARGPERIYGARAGEAVLVWYGAPKDGKSGSYGGEVPLSNGRTGELRGPVDAIALVPRSDFLYAALDGHVVVVETHGASPYAAIPVRGSTLGVDGEGDRLLVLGESRVELIDTGRHALAWRLPGVLLAAVLAFFVVLLARRLFASPLVAIFAGLAVVLDGSMFAQARIGMNDIYVATFLVMGWYFVVAAHRPRGSATLDLVLAGALFGLALASKWAAAYALAALGLYSIVVTALAWGRDRPGTGGPFDLLAPRGGPRAPRRLPLNALFLLACFFGLPVAIYLASYVPWFGGPMTPFGWDLRELTQQMYWYHSSLTAPHPAGSPWWSWPFVLKPVYWYLGSPGDGQTAVIYDAGNVVLFWGGVAAFFWALAASIRARSFALAIVLFALLSQYVAWMPISRVLFFYHFFTALPFFLIVLAAGLTALWESGRRRAVAGYLAVAAAAFAFFYPFVSGQPVPADQAAAFFVLPTWQYDCQFYPAFSCPSAFRSDVPLAPVAGRIAVALGTALLAFAGLYALQQRGFARVRGWVSRLPRRYAPR